jgi:hypothetical protein
MAGTWRDQALGRRRTRDSHLAVWIPVKGALHKIRRSSPSGPKAQSNFGRDAGHWAAVSPELSIADVFDHHLTMAEYSYFLDRKS